VVRWQAALVLTGAVTTSLAAGTAHAYVRTKMASGTALAWKNPCLGMIVHNVDPPAPLTPELVLKAATQAGLMWSRPRFTCTPLQVATVASKDPRGVAANDGVNRISFRRQRWCRDEADPASKCYDPSIVAVTTVTAAMDGAILDADIEVNAVNFTWADLTVAGSKGQDLQSTLTHEFGHLLGLDHNCYAGVGKRNVDNLGKAIPDCALANNVQRQAIMFPTTLETNPIRRNLSGDEGTAICQVYPTKGAVPTCKAPDPNASPAPADGGADAEVDGGTVTTTHHNDDGGCNVAHGHSGGGGLAALTALGLLGLIRRRRAGR
jgi:MYXO-CTERM domain-containing protein